MEILGERPVWSMNDSEKLSRLDATVAEMARHETYYLHLIADLDTSGYAKDIGAGDTARFLSTRYRIDPTKARRDVRLAKGLGKYDAVAAALPDPADPFPDHRPMHPAQAAAIISELEKVPTTVSPENLHAAEQQLVNLARTFNPKELRDAADRMRHILDTDGPEPEEHRAYQRESLTLQSADKGVKFRGYLANENAELFRTLIHAGAKPHKTVDGEPDPRTRDKRQADALTTLLNTAATVTHTATPDTPTNPSARAADTSVHPTPTTAADTPPSATTPRTAAPNSTSTHHDGDDTSPDAPTRGRPSGPNRAQPDFSAATRRSDDTQRNETPAGHNTSGGYIPGHGPKAHLTITIDYTALKAATADAIGDPVFGDALSAAAVRRLACDAQVLPIVLGSKSQPLDVGTTKRLVTAPIRLALNARDRGCVVCGAPPIQCEAHHLVHRIDGGDTCVSNLVLLRLSHESRVLP